MSYGFGRINDIAHEHWKWVEKMGWHNSTPLEKIALLASEIGEAANECRDRDKGPSSKFGSELADIILRALDIAECYNINIEQEIINKMSANMDRGSRGRTV